MGQLFIDGAWVSAVDGGRREIRSPAYGTLVAEVDEAGPKDTELAIAAARRSFDDGRWSSVPAPERGALLLRVADLLQRDKARLAKAETDDTGKRVVESEIDMDDITNCFRWFGHISATDDGRLVDTGIPAARSKVVHEPVGVCGLITPWNYPLLQTAWKVAPALGAGCSFVLKPSELTPHTAIILMELLAEAGLPDGVANLVLGAGAAAGAPLSSRPRRGPGVSFTGGLHTGRKIMAVGGGHGEEGRAGAGRQEPAGALRRRRPRDRGRQRPDGDLPALRPGVLRRRAARRPGVGARPDRRRPRRARPAHRHGRAGRPAHRDRPADLRRAPREGRGLRRGRRRRGRGAALRRRAPDRPGPAERLLLPADDPRPLHPGHGRGARRVVRPGAHRRDASPTSTTPSRIGNDTSYGLAGAVFSSDHGNCEEVAARLRHGTIWINDFGPYVPAAEWGGFGHSGFGRELGREGLAEYQEAKHIWTNTRPGPTGWFPSSSQGSGS